MKKFLLIALIVLGINFVSADGTYFDYSSNSIAVIANLSGGRTATFNAPVDARLVAIQYQQTTTYDYFAVSSTPITSSGHYFSEVLSSTWRAYGGYYIVSTSIAPSTPTVPIIDASSFDSALDAVIYYTYGDGAAAGPTFDYYCSGCQSFYFNSANSRYGNINVSSSVRFVYFNDYFFAVSLNSFTAQLNTSGSVNPTSCGSNNATVRSSSYGGVTFYYLQFGKSTFD